MRDMACGRGIHAGGALRRVIRDALMEARRRRHDLLTAEHLRLRPGRWTVLLHDDDRTTMDFVVRLLCEVFHKPADEAGAIMPDVHRKGVGICGVHAAEVAEAKVGAVSRRARAAGFPLRRTMEECEPDVRHAVQ